MNKVYISLNILCVLTFVDCNRAIKSKNETREKISWNNQ